MEDIKRIILKVTKKQIKQSSFVAGGDYTYIQGIDRQGNNYTLSLHNASEMMQLAIKNNLENTDINLDLITNYIELNYTDKLIYNEQYKRYTVSTIGRNGSNIKTINNMIVDNNKLIATDSITNNN